MQLSFVFIVVPKRMWITCRAAAKKLFSTAGWQCCDVLRVFLFLHMPKVKRQLHKTNQRKGRMSTLSAWRSGRIRGEGLASLWFLPYGGVPVFSAVHCTVPSVNLRLFFLFMAASNGEKWLDIFQLHGCKSLHLSHAWVCEGNQRQWKVGQYWAGAAWCHDLGLGITFPFNSPWRNVPGLRVSQGWYSAIFTVA